MGEESYQVALRHPRMSKPSLGSIREGGMGTSSMPLHDGLPSRDADLSVAAMPGNEVEFDELLSFLGTIAKEEARALNDEISQIVQDLGGSAPRYRRERRGALRNLIIELYSAPRVTAAAKLMPLSLIHI